MHPKDLSGRRAATATAWASQEEKWEPFQQTTAYCQTQTRPETLTKALPIVENVGTRSYSHPPDACSGAQTQKGL